MTPLNEDLATAAGANGSAAAHRLEELRRRREELERELAAVRDEMDVIERTENPPDPELLASMQDFKWFREQMSLGAFPDDWIGHYVLVFDKRVVAHGEELVEILDQAERETGLPRHRFAICCVDGF